MITFLRWNKHLLVLQNSLCIVLQTPSDRKQKLQEILKRHVRSVGKGVHELSNKKFVKWK